MAANSPSSTSPPATNLDKVSETAFRTIVLSDLKAQVKNPSLRTQACAFRWRRVLAELVREYTETMLRMKAQADEYQQECLADGPAGKGDWFRFQASYETRRVAVRDDLLRIQSALGEAKDLVRTLYAQDHPKSKPYVGESPDIALKRCIGVLKEMAHYNWQRDAENLRGDPYAIADYFQDLARSALGEVPSDDLDWQVEDQTEAR